MAIANKTLKRLNCIPTCCASFSEDEESKKLKLKESGLIFQIRNLDSGGLDDGDNELFIMRLIAIA